jgi:hypothetical protein
MRVKCGVVAHSLVDMPYGSSAGSTPYFVLYGGHCAVEVPPCIPIDAAGRRPLAYVGVGVGVLVGKAIYLISHHLTVIGTSDSETGETIDFFSISNSPRCLN